MIAMKLSAAASVLLVSLALSAPTGSAQVAWPELILRAQPSPLAVGATGLIQVQIVTTERLSNAALAATAAPSTLAISPARLTVGRVEPPSSAPRTPIFNPSPPVHGVVPSRNFRIAAAQAGTYEVTVTLSYDGGSISRSAVVTVR